MANKDQAVAFFHTGTGSILLVSLLYDSISRDEIVGYKIVGFWFWKKNIPVFKNSIIPRVRLRITKYQNGGHATIEEKTWETKIIPIEASDQFEKWRNWAENNGFIPTPALG
jgi:hypothetical protein